MSNTPLLAIGFTFSLAISCPAGAEEISWYAIPTVGFDTDDLVGFGARAEVSVSAEGYAPYKAAYMAQSYVTITGYQSHEIRVDRVGLGASGDLRLTAQVSWQQWNNDGYWGIGNGTTREREFVGPFDRDDPARKRYRYTLLQPNAHVTARRTLEGPWSVFGALSPRWSRVGTYEGSLLAEQQPHGMDGGLSPQILGGVIYDTRDPEPAPRAGAFLELTQRVSPPAPDNAGTFGGTFLSLRGYQALGGRVVIAGRAMAEWLYGDVPFYEMVHWGASTPIAGFGGSETIRGVTFGRWRAPGKAVLNGEVRIDAVRHQIAGEALTWQLVPWLDAGAVFGAGDDATAPAPSIPIHPAAGLGVHPVYAEQFVARMDAGFGLDPITETDGSVTWAPSFGFYLVFDQTF